MTTYSTGNPVPSTDVRDLSDNAQNLDEFSNGQLDFYADRLGVSRQSLQGIRNASQYQILGPYAAGLEFTSYNQVTSYLGEFYAPGPGLTLPYTTTGSGAAEIAAFRSVGDATLRADLANVTDPAKGAGLVGRSVMRVDSVAELRTVPGRLDGDQVLLVSYFSGWGAAGLGPSGGGMFTWDASRADADNGGTIFSVSGVTAGRWVRGGNKKIAKIEEWGAVAYDSGVDTGSVITAISAYLEPLGGGVITTDGGDFYLSTTASIGTRVRVIGTGPAHTNFITTINTIDAFSTSSNARYVSIESAAITSQGGVGVSNAAIRNDPLNGGARHRYIDLEINSFQYGHNCGDIWWDNYLEDIRWNSCGTSFYHSGTGGLNINNHFIKCYSNEPSVSGMRLGPLKNTIFHSCNFGGHPTIAGKYIDLLGNSYGVKFTGCNFEKTTLTQDVGGVTVWSGAQVSFDSCTFVANALSGAATRAFEIQSRDTSVVKIYNCSIISPGAGMQAAYSINTSRLIIGSNRDFTPILDSSTNKAKYTENTFSGSASGVSSGNFLSTGKGSVVSQFYAVQIPALGGYPSVSVSTDEKTSTGTVKLRFTNLSDGSANTAGVFNIDWIAT